MPFRASNNQRRMRRKAVQPSDKIESNDTPSNYYFDRRAVRTSHAAGEKNRGIESHIRPEWLMAFDRTDSTPCLPVSRMSFFPRSRSANEPRVTFVYFQTLSLVVSLAPIYYSEVKLLRRKEYLSYSFLSPTNLFKVVLSNVAHSNTFRHVSSISDISHGCDSIRLQYEFPRYNDTLLSELNTRRGVKSRIRNKIMLQRC